MLRIIISFLCSLPAVGLIMAIISIYPMDIEVLQNMIGVVGMIVFLIFYLFIFYGVKNDRKSNIP